MVKQLGVQSSCRQFERDVGEARLTEGRCPSCGGEIVFSAGSAQVVVCQYCQTLVVRKGASLEAHGRIGRVVDTDSPLRLGLEGRYRKDPFRIVGHVQKTQGQAPWDEWHLAFDDGRAAWVAESEGALHLLFEGQGEGDDEVDLPLSELVPGHRFTLRKRRFAVEEVHRARTISAEGQLPSEVSSEVETVAVDATGPEGVFATLDYGTGTERPTVYFGLQIQLEDLGIPPDTLQPRRKKVALDQLRCTNCNGMLELRAPDRTKRIACPFCAALLDATDGKFSILQVLSKPSVEPTLPLGARGKLMGHDWTCIGFLQRSCTVEGMNYPWQEYLLFHHRRGFVWLMESNGHWTYLEPLAAGQVALHPARAAYYEKRHFKCFQMVTANTDFVLGEFYWEVRAGESAEATEYVDPPNSINTDKTESEITYTYGTYVPHEEIKEAFRLKSIENPHGIAPAQPNPHRLKAKSGVQTGLILAALLLAMHVVSSATAASELVLDTWVPVREGIAGSNETIHFTPPFTISQSGVLEFTLESKVNDTWLGVQADLVNEETQEVTSLYAETSFYSGSAGGESWTEGERRAVEYLSSVPAGRYVLRLTPSYEGRQSPGPFRVQLVSDVSRGLWFWLALLLLAVPLGIRMVLSNQFETYRWHESNFS